jgi:hypothetical protein
MALSVLRDLRATANGRLAGLASSDNIWQALRAHRDPQSWRPQRSRRSALGPALTR